MKFRCLKKDIVKSIGVTENVVEGKVIYNIMCFFILQAICLH